MQVNIAAMADISEYLTVKEAAEALGYHAKSVYRMIDRGDLEADKKAGIWLIPKESIKKYREAVAGKAKHDPRRGLES